MFERSAVMARMVLVGISPIRARGKMWCFARMREECCVPMPQKASSAFCEYSQLDARVGRMNESLPNLQESALEVIVA